MLNAYIMTEITQTVSFNWLAEPSTRLRTHVIHYRAKTEGADADDRPDRTLGDATMDYTLSNNENKCHVSLHFTEYCWDY